MPARLEPGTSLVVITGHDPVSALSVEARLTTTGTPLTHVAMGLARRLGRRGPKNGDHRPRRGAGCRLAGEQPPGDGSLIRWLVPVLDALVEGAWIAVVDALFAVISGSAPLGPFPFALAAGLSMAWTRRAGDRASAYVGLAVLYVGAFVGCGFLGGALAPGGSHVGPTGSIVDFAQVSALLGGLAVFRGSRHAEVIDDDLVVGFLLRIGIPLLALPWLVGAQFEEPAPRPSPRPHSRQRCCSLQAASSRWSRRPGDPVGRVRRPLAHEPRLGWRCSARSSV